MADNIPVGARGRKIIIKNQKKFIDNMHRILYNDFVASDNVQNILCIRTKNDKMPKNGQDREDMQV